MTAKQAIWAQRVREWKASGKTLQEFSAGQPYKPLTLRWWAYELRRRGELRETTRGRAPRASASIKLARVVRRPDVQPNSRPIAVEMSGARILVERGFDPAVLSEIVRALGGGQ